MLFFQSKNITGKLDSEFGDVQTKIVELEFILLQLFEKDLIDNTVESK